ncbi:F0F1 ATP synthase subunit alpha [Candidatus Gottesmanbacteria bacterium RIFCSPHIGHO2_02_FULL_39_11]|uniref:ATP synthase subunit alpha n=1 Tax=Candidatus Gottesmanbacteria bacterium RIFCSPHIGHO2_02_FULL_39_11 TaxID=1798382 RepID=A0A1F5ZVV4_9BACT|nr:MAG: F0F1 ATP synthase subunit alpha [Candidatus Gottesmanbacteria bacterium RIFCSPHIGHO2_02_FULL_39_11]
MSNLTASDLIDSLKKKIQKYSEAQVEASFIGKVVKIADGVVSISGLKDIAYNEMVEFENGVQGLAINLEENTIGAIVLGEYLEIKEGFKVRGLKKLLSVGVGEGLIGRVVDPLGNPEDGKGAIKFKKYNPLEKIAPGVVARQSVNTPLQTGLKAIDAMIPIGRGQRELIIGDRAVGKTSIAIDTIINQKNENVICIYVAIGQKASRIAQIVATLEKYQAMSHTIIVTANAADSAALQYLAPYAGCAIGEYFMDEGKDALIVYDDLSKHAWAYRQISIILKRPSGREAYPGDIFYLHSKLLERSCRLNKEHGGGSLTALPIIETQAGDISAYIPTNVISITDGQIFLESDLFYAGIRPAINVGISVSRVGGSAQIKATKQVAGTLRLDLAQYRNLAAFAQFSSDLDAVTKKQIERGSRMVELLKQKLNSPMPVVEQIVVIFAGTAGFLDDIPIGKISEFETRYLEYMKLEHAKLLKTIEKEQKLSDETIEKLKKAITEFKKTF